MAFDNPQPASGGPDPRAGKLNEMSIAALQAKIGGLFLALANVEAQAAMATEELREARAELERLKAGAAR